MGSSTTLGALKAPTKPASLERGKQLVKTIYLGGNQQEAETEVADSPVKEQSREVPITLHGEKGVVKVTESMLAQAKPILSPNIDNAERIFVAMENWAAQPAH